MLNALFAENKMIKCYLQKPGYTFLLVLLFITFVEAQETNNQNLESSGGNYTISKSVVAGGGKPSAQTSPAVDGTTAQAVAGYNSSGGQFQLYSGFWTPETAAPTAAFCVVSGQVLIPTNQKPLSKVTVTITGGANMTERTTTTDREGRFAFIDIEAGGFYIVTVERRGYWFTPANMAFSLVEDKSDVNFFGNRVMN